MPHNYIPRINFSECCCDRIFAREHKKEDVRKCSWLRSTYDFGIPETNMDILDFLFIKQKRRKKIDYVRETVGIIAKCSSLFRLNKELPAYVVIRFVFFAL